MKKHYRHIDVLKGLCILIVIFEHAKWDRSFKLKTLFPFWDRIAIPCFMVISGFVYAASLQDKTLKEYYSYKNISRKLKRYLIPFLFVYLLEHFLYFIISRPAALSYLIETFGYDFETELNGLFTTKSLFKALFTGSYGPGNYYTPVIIQLIFLFPLLYLFIRRFRYKGLVASAFFCLCAELWQYTIGLPRTVYRYLILRHIMTICFGIYLHEGFYKRNIFLNLLSLVTGITYIIAHSYYKWTPVFFNNGWADVNFVACFFFCPVVAFLLSHKNMHCKPLEYIGKASYHIYLTQMVYYNFIKRDIMVAKLTCPYKWWFFSMIIIVFIGLSFYQLEILIRRSLQKEAET